MQDVDSREEMKEAKEGCNKGGKKDRCFRVVLPVTYTMPDGSEITIEEKEDRKMLRSWYQTNPGYDEKPMLQFPVTIKWYDGEMQDVDSREEMKEAKETCEEGGND